MANKREKKTSIQRKLLSSTIRIVGVTLLSVGIVASIINYQSTESSLEQTMVETVRLAATTITHEMEGYERLAVELSYNPILTSATSGKSELAAECEAIAKRNGVSSIGVTDASGIALLSGDSVTDRAYFNVPKQTGKSYVSDPIIRKDTGEMNIITSAPILENNTFKGVVYIAIDASVLCETAANIKIGETGNASIINNKGDTIGYEDVQLVLDAYNTQNEVANDKELSQLAEIEKKVMNGESGFGTYSYGGVKKYAAYAAIEGTPGWGIYVAVAQSEFLYGTYLGIGFIAILSVIFILISIVLIIRTAKQIVKPIQLCVKRIALLADGDIHSEIPKITTGDETQILAESMQSLMQNMQKVIGDIDYCLVEMSNGNFTVESKEAESYVGDFSNILQSVIKLKETLSDVIIKIMDSSAQVTLGADQMAQNAMALAEGATEQAGAVEELSATIAEVTDTAKSSAKTAEDMFHKVNDVMTEAEERNEEMRNLGTAMERITATSNEIKNIISTIEDIASQTNLLSLNASIEAARAGDAGRGFAVVAEQIGKLAADSGKSAVDTKQLIEKSLQEVESGNVIAASGVEAFEQIIEYLGDFAESADRTSQSSKSQAETLKEVELGIEQISTVVQSNSASAEESSATSEELSAQAENLNELMNKFKC